jgi:hypothetical protein
MGDMADLAIEEMEDYEMFRQLYRIGQLEDVVAFDRGIIDELGYEIGSEAKAPTCKHCNKTGLAWKQHKSGKWWLIEADGSWHTCSKE